MSQYLGLKIKLLSRLLNKLCCPPTPTAEIGLVRLPPSNGNNANYVTVCEVILSCVEGYYESGNPGNGWKAIGHTYGSV
jgi:hypothetical protein